ncbi:lipoyl(octanoyl) transferase LipB [Fangia hongkongensis]|uniref:lipoyl(octanoyl) transferase LipB n=1 Tax=Fangia hongkongensis TaxID=270495 RepID=UPI00035E542F|nr:lipoyl(octanoyl) transferase LipB [Fangia hongkongensis]MBK2123665.1 lipoyl(octanoyl) transferase LipB [Fangia hongkongensis]
MRVRHFPLTDYQSIFDKMLSHTEETTQSSENEIWCVEHPPVFTQGRHGKKEHLLNAKDIPVVQSDRGGQITYHGPGQAVIYFMFDLKSLNLGIKDLVCLIEKSTLALLNHYQIDSHLIDGAPGIYVQNKKIASLGLRVKKFKTYHGLAINTNMDLTPFSYINPCGYKDMEMTQICDFNPNISLQQVFQDYINIFKSQLEKSSDQLSCSL